MSYRMLLLFYFLVRTVLEGPLDNVSLRRSSLDMMAFGELAPEVVKFMQLNEMPDIAQRGGNDSRLGDGGGGWNATCHDECFK